MSEQLALDVVEPPKRKKERPVLKKATEVMAALRLMYNAQAYALFREVGNSTGFKCQRHADALIMSLWPSRGMEIIGFEIKVSRTDWLKELAHPEKADPIAGYCDRWAIAVGDEEIVKVGELPPTWGLLVPSSSGGLRWKTPAPSNEQPKPIDRNFLAAVLRCAPGSRIGEDFELRKARDEAFVAGEKSGRDSEARKHQYAKEAFDRLATQVESIGWTPAEYV